MCVKYEIDGKELDYLPAAVDGQLRIKPIYKTYNMVDKPYLKHQIDFRDVFNRVIDNWLT